MKTVTYQKMNRSAGVETGKVTDRQYSVERMLARGLIAKIRGEKYSL